MRKDVYYDSCGSGKIHASIWYPETQPAAIMQIVHGIAEHVARYDAFAKYLNNLGYLVVAEDHMGHGQSAEKGRLGYFTGGWMSAVKDTYCLLENMRKQYPGLPYVLFGHSMGSFLARTILYAYPESGISAAVICGTGWMPSAALTAGRKVCDAVCRKIGEQTPSTKLQNLFFFGYNRRVEHRRTDFDWLCRDTDIVDAYIADPMCGFVASCGLLRDVVIGMTQNQKPENLAAMCKNLPVLFIAGGDDPVGNFGAGVRRTAEAFRQAGMKNVSERIYPLCRHEILNEINHCEIFEDTGNWLRPFIQMGDLNLELNHRDGHSCP